MVSKSEVLAKADTRGAGAARQAAKDRTTNRGPRRTARLDQLIGNPLNPRDALTDDAEIEGVAETLQTGQLQEVVVIERHVFEAAYPEYEGQLGPALWVVILGNRRLAAARHAGLDTLNIRIDDNLRTADEIETAILVENIQRKGLPPLLEAQMLARRVAAPGSSVRKVAAAIGKSFAYVQQRLNLNNLVPEAKALLRAERIMIKPARLLGALPEDVQRRYLQLDIATMEEALALPPDVRKQFNDGQISAEQALATQQAADPESPSSGGQAADATVYPVHAKPEPPSAGGEPDPPVYPVHAERVPAPNAEGTPKPDRAAANPRVLVLRIEDPTPRRVAAQLRAHLADEDIAELVKELSAS